MPCSRLTLLPLAAVTLPFPFALHYAHKHLLRRLSGQQPWCANKLLPFLLYARRTCTHLSCLGNRCLHWRAPLAPLPTACRHAACLLAVLITPAVFMALLAQLPRACFHCVLPYTTCTHPSLRLLHIAPATCLPLHNMPSPPHYTYWLHHTVCSPYYLLVACHYPTPTAHSLLNAHLPSVGHARDARTAPYLLLAFAAAARLHYNLLLALLAIYRGQPSLPTTGTRACGRHSGCIWAHHYSPRPCRTRAI